MWVPRSQLEKPRGVWEEVTVCAQGVSPAWRWPPRGFQEHASYRWPTDSALQPHWWSSVTLVSSLATSLLWLWILDTLSSDQDYIARFSYYSVSSVQFSSVAQLCLTLPNPTDCSTPGLPVHPPTPGAYSNSVPWVGDAIQPSCPLSSPSPPALNLSQHQGLFKWVSSSQQVAKVWSFSFNISPSNEHPGLIFFRMDWLDLLAVHGTLKSLLQHHSSKASILWCSTFFIV